MDNFVKIEPDVYYTGKYWNDITSVRDEINFRLTGDTTTNWIDHFKGFSNRVFKKALFINCGNGWVDREFIDKGIINEGVGLDISNDLLAQARKDSAGRSLRYYQVDINLADFIENGFDLIVNHAAGHHIKYIERVFHKIALELPDDGVFLNMDYVGPHRNQYIDEQWGAINKLNSRLDLKCRADLSYPDLLTMLATDPSEAIHSELIIPTIYKYFTVGRHSKAGGALAYPILTHNKGLWKCDPSEREHVASNVMKKDFEHLNSKEGESMFDYIVASPNKKKLDSCEVIVALEQEKHREAMADKSGGYYEYPRCKIGQALRLLRGESGRKVLSGGFSFPEESGSWTDGHVAKIRFHYESLKQFNLKLSVVPFCHNAPQSQSAIVLVNGHFIELFTISAPSELSISFTNDYLCSDYNYEVAFCLPDASQYFGLNDSILDGRKLGLLVKTIWISED